jgi:hypothetical protein
MVVPLKYLRSNPVYLRQTHEKAYTEAATSRSQRLEIAKLTVPCVGLESKRTTSSHLITDASQPVGSLKR